jgi:hypothetical protein
MDVYEKLTGRSAWLLGLATLRELLQDLHFTPGKEDGLGMGSLRADGFRL